MERYTEDALMSDMILCLRELDSHVQPNTCRVLAKLATDYTHNMADAQATVEALQANRCETCGAKVKDYVGGCPGCSAPQCCPMCCRVEALQRERDHAKKMAAVQKEVADNQTWHVRELTAALDAERGRYELLNVERNAIDDKRHVLHEQLANTIEAAAQQEGELAEIQALAANLKSQLTQLQALVRAAASAPGKDWLEWQLKLGEALDGICPKDRALANDANREMGLPDDEDWGDK